MPSSSSAIRDIDELIALPRGVGKRRVRRSFCAGYDVAIALAPRFAEFALVGATGAPVRVGYTYVRR